MSSQNLNKILMMASYLLAILGIISLMLFDGQIRLAVYETGGLNSSYEITTAINEKILVSVNIGGPSNQIYGMRESLFLSDKGFKYR